MLKISNLARSSIIAGFGAAALLAGSLVSVPAASASSTYEAYICDQYANSTTITAQIQGVNQRGTYVFSPWETVYRYRCTFVSNWWWVPEPIVDTTHNNAWDCSGPSGGVLWCYAYNN